MKKIIAVYKEFTSFDGSLFVYSLSFSFLLALAPTLIIFVMLFNFAYLDPNILIQFLGRFIPKEFLGDFILYLIPIEYNLLPALITLCTSFWLASRSVYSFLLISAQHESVEVPKWSIRVRAIYLFICLAIMIIACIFIGTWLNDYLPLVSAMVMFILFTLMYRSLSFRKRNMSFGIIGGLFSTIAILGIAALFFTLVNEFTSYETVYGSLASLVTLLLSIYTISFVIYFGYCLNLVFEDNYLHEDRLPMKSAYYFSVCQKLTNYIFRK